MSDDVIRATILQCLSVVAPEVDSAQLRSDIILRDQLDLDSIDLLNFFISLHKQFKIEIPEQDYGHLLTLAGCQKYIRAKLSYNKGGSYHPS